MIRSLIRYGLLGDKRIGGGEFFGIPPTGRRVRVEGSTFTTLGEDGLVIEDVHFADSAALVAQLGLG